MHIQGRILTPGGFRDAELHFGDTITELRPSSPGKHLILPGFIDTHVHGGGGGDTMDGLQGILTLSRFHAEHGTTTLLPTTITNPWDNILQALEAVKEAQQVLPDGHADLPWVHLEGPFISPNRLGAQPPFTVAPDPEKLQQLLDYQLIRVTTVAPEMEGVTESLPHFIRAGVRISIGHTCADFDTTKRFIEKAQALGGIVAATHTYNAMGSLSGRDPSVLGAVLGTPSVYAEVILDLQHVHSGSFELLRQLKQGNLMMITDAMRAAGMQEGTSELGGQEVIVHNNRATLPDGTLAGSLLTLDQALRNAVQLGVSLEEASEMLSGTPARYLGLTDRGSIEIGKRADFVVLDDNLNVVDTIISGRSLNA